MLPTHAGGEPARVLAARLQRLVRLHREPEAPADALTGLPQRRTMDTWIEQASQVDDVDAPPTAAVFLDIDHFKRINDAHDHSVGDEVLMAVGRMIRTRLGPGDRCSRHGGEEFCVVVPAGLAEGVAAAERLREAVEQTRIAQADGPALSVTVSIGVAEWAGAPEALAQWVQRASSAVQRAKRAGRNRVEAAPRVNT